MRYLNNIILLVSLSLCLSCAEDSTKGGESSLQTSEYHFSALTNEAGQAAFSFPLPESGTSFQIAAFTSEGLITLLSLKDPQGREVRLDSSEVTRQGHLLVPSPHCLNYPFLNGSLAAGTYTALYRLVEQKKHSPLAGKEINLSVITKVDRDLNSGTLKVNIVLVGPVGASTDITASLKKARDIWREFYASAGILLDDQWYAFDGPAALPSPQSGDSFYNLIVQNTRPAAVNVIWGSQLQGLKAPENKYGLVGSVPGPFPPSVKGVVAISVLAVTGADGRFDFSDPGATQTHNDETRLAAEEMGRLTAHYLGLENIVTFSGNKVAAVDSLPDTSSCLTITACRSYKEVRNNLMFPFPLDKYNSPYDDPDERGREFWPRDVLTKDQRLVLNRSVFVD